MSTRLPKECTDQAIQPPKIMPFWKNFGLRAFCMHSYVLLLSFFEPINCPTSACPPLPTISQHTNALQLLPLIYFPWLHSTSTSLSLFSFPLLLHISVNFILPPSSSLTHALSSLHNTLAHLHLMPCPSPLLTLLHTFHSCSVSSLISYLSLTLTLTLLILTLAHLCRYLCPEPYANSKFVAKNNINLFKFGVEGNKARSCSLKHKYNHKLTRTQPGTLCRAARGCHPRRSRSPSRCVRATILGVGVCPCSVCGVWRAIERISYPPYPSYHLIITSAHYHCLITLTLDVRNHPILIHCNKGKVCGESECVYEKQN